ncbi:MAG TPA: MerR family transcriptional regulator [Steroidobacteraceae bacterium]|nr:MerR family transcriptional regulator [Steroidobacteraceae bacterium]
MSFTVGQLAKLTGLTVRALHHYDAIGLLTPSRRSESGYRLYTQPDIVKLFRIQALQRFGLSLTEIETALAREGATLPEMIAQQLAELDDQIQQAAALRIRLNHLREVLARGDEPDTREWLAAVELITHYDKYCSSEELNRLIEHNNDDRPEWHALIAEVHGAIESKLAPQSDEAQALLNQWSNLMLRKVGGDINLGVKLKLAYLKDSNLQSRLEMQGFDSKVMEYLVQVMVHGHLALWSKHLTTDEVQRLRPQGAWQQKLIHVIGALRHEMGVGAAFDSDAVQTAISDWNSLIDIFVADDSVLRGKVLTALQSDADIQRVWIITPDLQEFMGNARASQL